MTTKLTSIDWIHLQTAMHHPTKGTTETHLRFGKFEFQVFFDKDLKPSVKLYYIVSDEKIRSIGEFVFLEKDGLTYYYKDFFRYSNAFPVQDPQKFTLQELFTFLEKVNSLALTQEYSFLRKHDHR